MPSRYTLGKEERLKSRKQTEFLFKEGKKFMSGSLRVYYHFYKDGKPGLKFGAGVSVRLFKRAVDRNRIKRLLREAWRLQKKSLQEILLARENQLNIFFLYTGKELPDYHQVFELAGKAISRLGADLNKKH